MFRTLVSHDAPLSGAQQSGAPLFWLSTLSPRHSTFPTGTKILVESVPPIRDNVGAPQLFDNRTDFRSTQCGRRLEIRRANHARRVATGGVESDSKTETSPHRLCLV
ncbi:hypothetical protein Pr1d_11270 [Bythopirellula goksoeyrii]|uniref:Uncharacterized protein n=1 Tax=Bythopirellula goksoeyrii TaxID=1400387 RepID=A0A5B9Q4G1_9BACT|nr:hypothetical protein Pr1d_11270 [Bythopirellula goksoeyrii]